MARRTDDIKSNIFTQRLKEVMNEHQDTTYSLGKYLELTHATISRYVNGLMKPKTTTIRAMANYFGVSSEWLLGKDVDKYDRSKDEQLNKMWTEFDKKYPNMSSEVKFIDYFEDMGYKVDFPFTVGISFNPDEAERLADEAAAKSDDELLCEIIKEGQEPLIITLTQFKEFQKALENDIEYEKAKYKKAVEYAVQYELNKFKK